MILYLSANGTDDNVILKKFAVNKIDRTFWQFCEKQYGYRDTTPTVLKFMVTMVHPDTLPEYPNRPSLEPTYPYKNALNNRKYPQDYSLYPLVWQKGR